MADYLDENWIGTNGSAWNSSNWNTSAVVSPATATIQSNSGQLVTGSGSFASDANVKSIVTATDVNAVVTMTPDGANEEYGSIGVRNDGTWSGSLPGEGYALEFDFVNGQYVLGSLHFGARTVLGTITGFTPGVAIRARIRVQGTTLQTKAWLVGNTEPSAWDLSVTDTQTAGPGVLTLSAQNGGNPGVRTILFNSFSAAPLMTALTITATPSSSPKLIRSTRKTAKYSASSTTSLLRSVFKPLQSVSTTSISLRKIISKPITFISASTASALIVKNYSRIFSAIITSSTLIHKSLGYRAATTSIITSNLLKSIRKIVGTNSTSTASPLFGRFFNILASPTSTIIPVRALQKIVSANPASSIALIRGLERKLSALPGSSANALKGLSKKTSAIATSTSAAVEQKVTRLTVTASVSSSSTLGKVIGVPVQATPITSVSIGSDVFVEGMLSISGSSTAIVSSSCVGNLSIGGGGNYFPVAETSSGSLSLNPQILTLANTTDALTITSLGLPTANVSATDSLAISTTSIGLRSFFSSISNSLLITTSEVNTVQLGSFNNLLVVSGSENPVPSSAGFIFTVLNISAGGYGTPNEMAHIALVLSGFATQISGYLKTSSNALTITGTAAGIKHPRFSATASNSLSISTLTRAKAVGVANESLHISSTEVITQLIRATSRSNLVIHSTSGYTGIRVSQFSNTLNIVAGTIGAVQMIGSALLTLNINEKIGTIYPRISGTADIRPRVLVTNKKVMQVL